MKNIKLDMKLNKLKNENFINKVSKILKLEKNEKSHCVILEKKHLIESTLTEWVLRTPLISKVWI